MAFRDLATNGVDKLILNVFRIVWEDVGQKGEGAIIRHVFS